MQNSEFRNRTWKFGSRKDMASALGGTPSLSFIFRLKIITLLIINLLLVLLLLKVEQIPIIYFQIERLSR